MTNRFKPDYQGAEHKGRITSVSNSALSYMQAPWWSYSDLNLAETCITWMENACSLDISLFQPFWYKPGYWAFVSCAFSFPCKQHYIMAIAEQIWSKLTAS